MILYLIRFKKSSCILTKIILIITVVAPSIPWRDLNTMPVNFEDLARDFMAHTNPGIVGEVMNLDDFLEELSDPDPKSAVMLNNENSNE